MEKFKAYRLTEVDKKIHAEFVECTLDELDPGELVVRVAYSDVNYKDALAATGKGRILLRSSCIGGIDLAGTVVSSTDARFAKGDAVLAVGHELGVKHHGGYAEYARIPADWAVKLPKGMTLWEAMAFGTAGLHRGAGGREDGAQRAAARRRPGGRERRHRRRRLDRDRRAGQAGLSRGRR